MSREAYQRAERCFALARSTTFAGERESAIARGTAIAKKAGLDLDYFDIPGRKRERQPTGSRLFEGDGHFGDNFRYARTVFGFDANIMAELAEALRAMERQSRSQREALDEERRRRCRQFRIDNAVDFLRARGNVVRRYADGLYTVDGHHAPDSRVSGETIIAAAQSRGWKG